MNKPLLIALLLAASGPIASANAQETVPTPPVQDYQGVPYMTGGVGEGERTQMLASASQYNLKLLFAEKGGAYVGDIAVVVTNPADKKVLELKSDGPLVLAKLPAGEYRVAAVANGKEQRRNVSIPATGQRSLAFYW